MGGRGPRVPFWERFIENMDCVGCHQVAEKHYLHVTDGHMAAGSLVETVEKKGPNKGPEPSVIAHHATSGKTVTLKNKAFPVTDHHDPSQEMPKWAMRDSNPRHLRCKRSALAN